MKFSKNQALGGRGDQTMFEFELAPNEFVWSCAVSVVFFKILSSCDFLGSFCITQKEQDNW